MAMSPIEKELRDATGLKAKRGEERQESLSELTRAVDDLDDDNWRRLGASAQNWFNAASAAIDNKKKIVDFEDAAKAEEVAEADEAEDDNGTDDDEVEEQPDEEEPEERPHAAKPKAKEESMAKTAKKARAATEAANGKDKPKAKVAKRKAAPAAAERQGDGVATVVARMIVKDPQVTKKQIVDSLEKRGRKVSPTTVSTILSRARGVLKEAKRAGHLKGMDF